MDQASPVSHAAPRSQTRSLAIRSGDLAEAFPTAGSETETSGEPDSPGPRPTAHSRGTSRSAADQASAAVQVFDEPLSLLGGCLLGVLTLMVPIAGVVTDRNLLPSRAAAGVSQGSVAERPALRPAVAAEIPGNQGPERTGPDR